jgi:hypothetical protein
MVPICEGDSGVALGRFRRVDKTRVPLRCRVWGRSNPCTSAGAASYRESAQYLKDRTQNAYLLQVLSQILKCCTVLQHAIYNLVETLLQIISSPTALPS